MGQEGQEQEGMGSHGHNPILLAAVLGVDSAREAGYLALPPKNTYNPNPKTLTTITLKTLKP